MTRRLLLAVCLAAACAKETPTSFAVGEHRVQAVVPEGWERLDQGDQVVLRTGETQLVFTDLGAAHPAGFRAEIERARALWRDGGDREAMTRLDKVPKARELFASEKEHDAFLEAWNRVAYASKDAPWSEVDAHFQELLATIAKLHPAPVDAIAREAAERLEHLDHRRELKSIEPRKIDGREAALVETWMTLTHSDARRMLLVIDEGRSLVLRCDRCDAAFDEVAESLHFGAGARR